MSDDINDNQVGFFAKFKCLFSHQYQTVHEIRDVYLLSIALDGNGYLEKVHYDVYLDQCKKCGNRRMKVIGGMKDDCHSGIKKLKYRWLRYGKR